MAFLVDLSESMGQKADAETARHELAMRALQDAIRSLPASSLVALRTYGGNYSLQSESKSCRDSVLEISFQARDNVDLRKLAFTPQGFTPLAFTVREVAKDFKSISSDYRRVVIIVSDGEDTCGGDLAAALNELRKAGVDLNLHIVALNPSPKAREALSSAAKEGLGIFYTVAAGDSLSTTLREIAEGDGLPGDLGGTRDAGSTLRAALPISPGRYESNYLGYGDKEDTFQLQASVPGKYLIELTPTEIHKREKLSVSFTLNGEKIGSSEASDTEGVVSYMVELPSQSDVFEIRASGNGLFTTIYQISVRLIAAFE